MKKEPQKNKSFKVPVTEHTIIKSFMALMETQTNIEKCLISQLLSQAEYYKAAAANQALNAVSIPTNTIDATNTTDAHILRKKEQFEALAREHKAVSDAYISAKVAVEREFRSGEGQLICISNIIQRQISELMDETEKKRQ